MATKIYKNLEKSVSIGDESLTYYDLEGIIDPAKYARLPYSIRILLESAVRNCDNFQVSEDDVRSGLKIFTRFWVKVGHSDQPTPLFAKNFKPSTQ